MNFTERGTGETTLVFLHFFGGSAKSWKEVVDILQPFFRCLAVDLPGFGESLPVEGQPTLENSVSELKDWIREQGLQRFTLIGHSMGGKMALALAAEEPPGLQRLILVAPSPPTPEPMDEHKKKEMVAAFGQRAALKKLVEDLVARPLSAAQTASVVDDHLRVAKKAWDGWIDCGSQQDISAQLKNLSLPVTIISGEGDRNFPGSFLKKTFAPLFPTAVFQEVRAVGHLVPVEQPQALAGIIRQTLV